MSSRYQIRIFESEEKDDRTAPGTVVVPLDRTFGMYAASADLVEEAILRDVQKGKLTSGRVYQICPQLGNLELIRSVAVGTDLKLQRVFLDPVAGLYSVLRRIRLADLKPRLTEEHSEQMPPA